jgi:dTDP-4-amino-4,6-dideoxygalactose transaminase
MSIPLVVLREPYLSIKSEVLAAVSAVFDSTQFVLGKEVAEFEDELGNHPKIPARVARQQSRSH